MSLITYLTTVRFGFGVLAELADDLRDLGVARPMVVSDEALVRSGLVGRVVDALPAGHAAALFDRTPGNPTEAAVADALALYRENACDGLVAVGGGSPIDLAKAVALLATHPGPLGRYAFTAGGASLITAAVAPGMDAITHCIETFLSPRDNPPAEAIALDGLGRAARAIERATADGTDRDARRDMLMAALEGGLTFQKGLGAVHALSHPLGGLKAVTLHHGTLNAVLLPHVLRFNAGHAGRKYEALRGALGLADGADLADAVASLAARRGLPRSLAAMGVGRDVLPAVARGAVADHSTATNPRLASEADYLQLLEQAFD